MKYALDVFELLQKKHEAMIKAGTESLKERTNDLPDLEAMNSERDDAFKNIKIVFDDMSNIEGDMEDLKMLGEKFSDIMEKEASLRNAAEDYRSCLKESMDRMKHGRAALKGYGGSGI